MSGEKAVERVNWLRLLRSYHARPHPNQGHCDICWVLADLDEALARIEQTEATAAAYREALSWALDAEAILFERVREIDGEWLGEDFHLLREAGRNKARAALTTDARSSEGVDGRVRECERLLIAAENVLGGIRLAAAGNQAVEVALTQWGLPVNETHEEIRALLADVPAEER